MLLEEFKFKNEPYFQTVLAVFRNAQDITNNEDDFLKKEISDLHLNVKTCNITEFNSVKPNFAFKLSVWITVWVQYHHSTQFIVRIVYKLQTLDRVLH